MPKNPVEVPPAGAASAHGIELVALHVAAEGHAHLQWIATQFAGVNQRIEDLPGTRRVHQVGPREPKRVGGTRLIVPTH